MESTFKTLMRAALLGPFAAALLAAASVCRAAGTPPSATLDLGRALAEAQANSPEVGRLRAALSAAGWQKLEALSAYLPHLGLHASQTLDQRYLYLGVLFGPAATNFPEAFPSSVLDLNASWTFFDGLEGFRSMQAADLADQAAALDLKDVRFRLDHEVRLRYDQALAAQAMDDVAVQDIATLQQHLDIATASLDSGLATRFDVLRVQAKLEDARAEKVMDDDNVALTRQALAEAMRLTRDARVLGGSLPVPDPALVAGVDGSAPSRRLDLKALQLRRDSAEKRAAAASAFWFPRLSVFGTDEFYHYDSYDPAILSTNGYQTDYTVGLNLDWDLFDGGLSLARQAQARQEAREAAQVQRQAELEAPLRIDTWKRRYLYNSTLYQAKLRGLEESQESVRLASLGLKAGTLTTSEDLDAELDLFLARAGLVQAQMGAAEALINLELALGEDLAPAGTGR